MGLIKNIFGAIFGIVGSLLKAVFGIFGLGKKSEFYLEADEADSGSTSSAEPKAVTQQQPEAPSAQESTPTDKAAPAPAAATPEAPAAIAAAPSSAPKPEPAPEPVGNFATDYLIAPSSVSGRRRPGPSLSPFKDLAKGMKLPSGAR
jgi:hypothetical protein